MFSIKNKLDKNLQFYLNQSYYNSYRVLIKCKRFLKDIETKILSLKGNVIRSIDSVNLICANVTPKAINRLIEYPEVSYICFDEYAHLCGMSISTANNTNISNNSNLTGKGVVIGLVDSGIYPHPDLLNPYNKIIKFIDLLNNMKYPYDDNGHGTSISGILCGSGYSSKFVYKGVAEKSEVCCYKAFNATGKGFVSDILFAIQCLIYEKDLNIRVLCLPFEIINHNVVINNFFDELLKIAINKNIIPIVPSGSNINGENSIQGIALSPYCITVGGIDTNTKSYQPYKFSSGGNKSKIKKPDLSAACVNIMCLNSNTSFISERNGLKLYPTKLKTHYINFNGTSAACAYLCGLCALLLEYNPKLNFNDIRSLIKISCTPLDDLSKSLVGEGILDLSKFLK